MRPLGLVQLDGFLQWKTSLSHFKEDTIRASTSSSKEQSSGLAINVPPVHNMRKPTNFEKEHYNKLVGRTVLRIDWGAIEGQPLPILILDGVGHDNEPAYFAVLADAEGNGPGHLDHNL